MYGNQKTNQHISLHWQILSFFDLVRYCVSVCNQIASHLHIFVFKIKPLTTAPIHWSISTASYVMISLVSSALFSFIFVQDRVE